MKDNSPSYIYKKEYLSDLLSISLLEKIEQLKNPHNSFGQNILLKSSYNCLKISNQIFLSIINSKVSLKEKHEPLKLFHPDHFKIIKELYKKYENSSFLTLKEAEKLPDIPVLLEVPEPKNIFQNYFKNNYKKNEINLINYNPEHINLLNRKREKEEFLNSPKIIIEKEDVSKDEANIEDSASKKNIFNLLNRKTKYLKNNFIKGQIHPGRKKKDSGEVGTHNKFSKDNMMRKLKNKVMESARKLINKVIKDESNTEFKYYKEMRKIEGIYSQELNIKFNFWFYFQELKDIFKFKMSSKYSKGDLESNLILIKKIYSKDRNKFPKTIMLFEMPFYQYYHDIFLGENKNWTSYFNIKENENYYQLDHFVSSNSLNKENDFEIYKRTIFNLAYNYEKFFLDKNPRISVNRKNVSLKSFNIKQIIEYIGKLDNDSEMLKIKFIEKASNYRPELKSYLCKINKNKNNTKESNINKSQKKEININNNTNEKTIHNDNDTSNKNINEKEKENNINFNIIEKSHNIINEICLNKNKKIFGISKGSLFKIEKMKQRNFRDNIKTRLFLINIDNSENKKNINQFENLLNVNNNNTSISLGNKKENESDILV